jgi:hypothetical protein
MRRGGRHSARAIGALLGLWAVLAQIALPSLHARIVARDRADRCVAVHVETTAWLRFDSSRQPAHDESDCPVCRSLLQARRFVAPSVLPLVAAQGPERHDTNRAIPVASASVCAAASPRAPPRSA